MITPRYTQEAEKLVSVVIPAYNAERFIVDAIKSVYYQKYRPIEIVVVNDGSTDSTHDLVTGISSIRPNRVDLTLIDLKENKGAANALQVGFSQAKGEFVSWLSADDVFIDPEKIRRQVRYMEKQGALWSYFTRSYVGSDISKARISRSAFRFIVPYRFLEYLFIAYARLRLIILPFYNPINGSSIMIKRDCIERYGQFDPVLRNVDADGDLWMRYSVFKAKLAAIGGAAVFYRIHPQQTSSNNFLMLYGCELTRSRILLTLEKNGRLKEHIKYFIPLLPIFMLLQLHYKRPLTTKVLCNHVLREYKNKLLRKFVGIVLSKAERQIQTLSIDENAFSNDLAKISDSFVIKEFEKKLLKG